MTENNQKKGGLGTSFINLIGGIAALITIIVFIKPNILEGCQKRYEVDDCTIVVSDFIGGNDIRDVFIRAIERSHLIDSFGANIIYWPLPHSSKTEGYLNELKKNIPEKHQILISGNYTSKKTFELFLYSPSDSISKLFNFPKISKFELLDTEIDILKDTLESSGLILVILNSFSYPEKCNEKYLEKLSKITLQSINKIPDTIIRNEVLVNNAELNYKMGYLPDSEKAMELAIKLAPNNIPNYARRALVKDTLNKFEEAFTDYTLYVTNFERSNNQLISNYKVRNFRLRMIDKSINLNDQSIFRNNFAKKRINEELKKDIEFYRQNKNDSLGTDKMIMDTEKVLGKINAYNVKVSGKVMDNFNNPIVGVKIKDHKSGDSTLTDNMGNYTIGLPYNINKLTFSKKGYKLVIKENIESTQTQNITLNHKMKEIKGKVFLGGKPIQGVLIKGYQDHFSTTTNHYGYYRLTVPEITTSLSGKHQGFHDQIVSLGNSSTVNFSLVPKKISGRVQNNLFKLTDALVSIRGTQSKTRTINNGFFELNVPSGSNTLDVSLRGYKSRSIPINQSTFNIILEDSLRNVTLKVFDNHNTMISNVSVYYNRQLVGTTNNSGKVNLQLPMRQLKLKLLHNAYHTEEPLIDIDKSTYEIKVTKVTVF